MSKIKKEIVVPKNLKKVRDISLTSQDLISFEREVKEKYENAKIKAPIHLSKGNEHQLIEIFKFIHPKDWVFSSWRNHYHALLHGFKPDLLMKEIINGRSMSISSIDPKFYSSSIVAGSIPISVGVAKALKLNGLKTKVWCFIGDMTFETGIFYEAHKYVKNFKLPLRFIVEDNKLSTNTPTIETWGKIQREIPDDVIYYSYERGYPHHGTGNWILF